MTLAGERPTQMIGMPRRLERRGHLRDRSNQLRIEGIFAAERKRKAVRDDRKSLTNGVEPTTMATAELATERL